MSDIIDSRLEIAALVARLNEATDRANIVIRDTESSLGKTHLGFEEAVDVDSQYKLEYRRINKRFRIAVTVSGYTKPWAECTREIKLRTITALPKLMAEIMNRAKELSKLCDNLPEWLTSIPIEAMEKGVYVDDVVMINEEE